MTWFDKIEEITFVSNTAAYFRPSSKTFPSIDAIYWDGEKLYLLQMTLNTKHPIVNAAVENILEWADSRNCCLVFAVPSRLANAFVRQDFLASGTSKRKIEHKNLKEGVRNLPQYVIGLDP